MTKLKKLQRILELVYRLNKETEHDWFFDFSGHTDSVAVHYNKILQEKCDACGRKKETEPVYLEYVLDVTWQTGINNLIKKLESHL